MTRKQVVREQWANGECVVNWLRSGGEPVKKDQRKTAILFHQGMKSWIRDLRSNFINWKWQKTKLDISLSRDYVYLFPWPTNNCKNYLQPRSWKSLRSLNKTCNQILNEWSEQKKINVLKYWGKHQEYIKL